MVRKFSKSLQVFDLSGVPLSWKERQHRNLSLYTALYHLTKSKISPQSLCVTFPVPAWHGMRRLGQAGPCLGAISWSMQVGQPQHDICPLNKSAARDEASAEPERNPVCMSPQLLLFPFFGAVPQDHTKKSLSVNGYEYLNTKKILP